MWVYLASLDWTCSQASEASESHSAHGFKPSPTVKETATLNLCSCRECILGTSRWLRSGTTLHRSEGPCYQASISSSEASPARTSVVLELEKAWQESAADFSTKLSDSPRKYGLSSYFSKTSQPYALEDFEMLSEHLPVFGMTVGGLVYLPRKLEPRTLESVGSCSLPTPTAQDYGTGGNGVRKGKQKPVISLGTMARRNLWPTPTTQDAKNNGAQAQMKRNTKPLNAEVGGQLNPTWVEWLMGYPLEWTALSAWATQWFRFKRKSRSKDLSASKEASDV